MKILFIDNLVKEFTDRFPVNDLGILNDFNSLLNPKLLPLDQATMIRCLNWRKFLLALTESMTGSVFPYISIILSKHSSP
jgi:hypothetical protein